VVERGEEAYVVEGSVHIGPEDLPLIFVGGEGLGGLLLGRFPTSFDGSYYRLGRMRVTVEWLEE
jgi:hypothetical protein